MLDLSASGAKVERARELFDDLESQINTANAASPPFAYTMIHKGAGKYEVWIVAARSRSLRYSIIIGDILHNLRSALDYIVVALVESAGAQVTRSHQFPIFDDKADYTTKSPKMLAGLTKGVSEIEGLQPYNASPPHYDLLFQLNHFSNADKHRLLSEELDIMAGTSGRVDPGVGIVSQKTFDHPSMWKLNDRFKIAEISYGKPYPDPTKVHVEGTITSASAFGAPGLGKHQKVYVVPLEFFKAACDHVAMIIDRFEKL